MADGERALVRLWVHADGSLGLRVALAPRKEAVPLVAVSIGSTKSTRRFSIKPQDGSYWLSCVCVFETDAKGRTHRRAIDPKERYTAGEKGRKWVTGAR